MTRTRRSLRSLRFMWLLGKKKLKKTSSPVFNLIYFLNTDFSVSFSILHEWRKGARVYLSQSPKLQFSPIGGGNAVFLPLILKFCHVQILWTYYLLSWFLGLLNISWRLTSGQRQAIWCGLLIMSEHNDILPAQPLVPWLDYLPTVKHPGTSSCVCASEMQCRTLGQTFLLETK